MLLMIGKDTGKIHTMEFEIASLYINPYSISILYFQLLSTVFLSTEIAISMKLDFHAIHLRSILFP